MKCVLLMSLPKARPLDPIFAAAFDAALNQLKAKYKEVPKFDGSDQETAFPEETNPRVHISNSEDQEGGNGGGGDSTKPMRAKRGTYGKCFWNFQFVDLPKETPQTLRFPAIVRPEICLSFDSISDAYAELNANKFGLLFKNVQIIGVSQTN
jgi:hypothetical protein